MPSVDQRPRERNHLSCLTPAAAHDGPPGGLPRATSMIAPARGPSRASGSWSPLGRAILGADGPCRELRRVGCDPIRLVGENPTPPSPSPSVERGMECRGRSQRKPEGAAGMQAATLRLRSAQACPPYRVYGQSSHRSRTSAGFRRTTQRGRSPSALLRIDKLLPNGSCDGLNRTAAAWPVAGVDSGEWGLLYCAGRGGPVVAFGSRGRVAFVSASWSGGIGSRRRGAPAGGERQDRTGSKG
jgi:hypothetical protein